MNTTEDTTTLNEPMDESTPIGEPIKVTVLEGMKVLFDEKVGLAPVQVVEKQQRVNGRNTNNDKVYDLG